MVIYMTWNNVYRIPMSWSIGICIHLMSIMSLLIHILDSWVNTEWLKPYIIFFGTKFLDSRFSRNNKHHYNISKNLVLKIIYHNSLTPFQIDKRWRKLRFHIRFQSMLSFPLLRVSVWNIDLASKLKFLVPLHIQSQIKFRN